MGEQLLDLVVTTSGVWGVVLMAGAGVVALPWRSAELAEVAGAGAAAVELWRHLWAGMVSRTAQADGALEAA